MDIVKIPSAIVGSSATEIAQKIAAVELSASEVVEAHIQRIQEVNPRLNAVIIPLFEQARSQAKAADEARSRGETLGLLHGVPITIKESFDVAGTVSNMGISALSQTPKQDAPLVKRLQEAGAIILGKTNVAQLLALNESDNPIYGRTLNPWNLERSPGGSSGGEAAIIAALGSCLGLGSDIGGSVRMPAHACGICSLKPTSSRLSMVGHVPLLPGQEAILAQPGPMARTVADLNLAMKVLAAPGQEAFDPSIPPVPWREPSDVKLENLRIAFFTDNDIITPSPAMRRAVREAALSLEKRGAIVEEWTPPDLLKALQLYLQLYGADGGVTSKRQLGNSKRHPQINQTLQTVSLPKPLFKMSAAIYEWLGQRLMAKLSPYMGEVSVSEYWRGIDERSRYRAAFMAALDGAQFDAILCPPCALAALTHGSGYFLLNDATYTIPYNLLGMPAGVVAATRVRPGEESDRVPSKQLSEQTASKVEQGSVGLPVGVQVAARHWREDIVLAVMAAIEEHFQPQPDYPVHPPV
ncbi:MULTISPECIES: amidase [Cyanophyceae]|uniref:amidase n=1 Tax=Cyanophyceae TaxID=3028117 RepID=UPI001681D028|nr:amidase [Trichocoleus sp. FACHB-40]MBD2006942.1 amidase [Trichocoleus sp. FACHB-40]